MKIWAHLLVRNEENFIWYAIMSVINHVDYMLVWDNESTDSTPLIIEEILKDKSLARKINYKKIPFKGEFREDLIRQQMLDVTESDWFILVDGDEIWSEDSIKKVVNIIQTYGKKIDAVMVPTLNLVGDIYHFQEKQAGQYELLGRKGHFNVRAFNRRIPGLRSFGRGWKWAWVDFKNRYITEPNLYKIKFLNAPYLHATHLIRSSDKSDKFKYELGISFSKNFKYPEVLYKKTPTIVSSPWKKISFFFWLISLILTPLRKIKRRLI